MAARKKRRGASKKSRTRKKRGGSRSKPRGASKKRRGKKKRSSKSNQVPLKVLEKRLGKLNGIVKSRGGSAY